MTTALHHNVLSSIVNLSLRSDCVDQVDRILKTIVTHDLLHVVTEGKILHKLHVKVIKLAGDFSCPIKRQAGLQLLLLIIKESTIVALSPLAESIGKALSGGPWTSSILPCAQALLHRQVDIKRQGDLQDCQQLLWNSIQLYIVPLLLNKPGLESEEDHLLFMDCLTVLLQLTPGSVRKQGRALEEYCEHFVFNSENVDVRDTAAAVWASMTVAKVTTTNFTTFMTKTLNSMAFLMDNNLFEDFTCDSSQEIWKSIRHVVKQSGQHFGSLTTQVERAFTACRVVLQAGITTGSLQMTMEGEAFLPTLFQMMERCAHLEATEVGRDSSISHNGRLLPPVYQYEIFPTLQFEMLTLVQSLYTTLPHLMIQWNRIVSRTFLGFLQSKSPVVEKQSYIVLATIINTLCSQSYSSFVKPSLPLLLTRLQEARGKETTTAVILRKTAAAGKRHKKRKHTQVSGAPAVSSSVQVHKTPASDARQQDVVLQLALLVQAILMQCGAWLSDAYRRQLTVAIYSALEKCPLSEGLVMTLLTDVVSRNPSGLRCTALSQLCRTLGTKKGAHTGFAHCMVESLLHPRAPSLLRPISSDASHVQLHNGMGKSAAMETDDEEEWSDEEDMHVEEVQVEEAQLVEQSIQVEEEIQVEAPFQAKNTIEVVDNVDSEPSESVLVEISEVADEEEVCVEEEEDCAEEEEEEAPVTQMSSHSNDDSDDEFPDIVPEGDDSDSDTA